MNTYKGFIMGEATAAKKYLSFDAATKTLAYSYMTIDVSLYDTYVNELASLYKRIESKDDLGALEKDLLDLQTKVRQMLVYHDGGVMDIMPGKKDKEVTDVERIQAVVDYVDNLPLVDPNTHVLIEYQMATNFKSRTVATALAALYAQRGHRITFVMPLLKNRVNFTQDLHYIMIQKRYKTTYTANKRHAILNVGYLAQHFEWAVNVPKKLLSHVSDAVMQTLGYFKFISIDHPVP